MAVQARLASHVRGTRAKQSRRDQDNAEHREDGLVGHCACGPIRPCHRHSAERETPENDKRYRQAVDFGR